MPRRCSPFCVGLLYRALRAIILVLIGMCMRRISCRQLPFAAYPRGIHPRCAKEFNRWLTEFLRTDGEFARPFEQASSGVAAEPWHISYLPQARQLEPWVKRDNVLAALEQADIELKKQIQQQLPTILAEYVRPV